MLIAWNVPPSFYSCMTQRDERLYLQSFFVSTPTLFVLQWINLWRIMLTQVGIIITAIVGFSFVSLSPIMSVMIIINDTCIAELTVL